MSAVSHTSSSPVLGRTLVAGAVAGMIAGAVMAMYAMMASATFLHQGFFTPMYGIASPLVGPDAMKTSMGEGLFFAPGPALVGLVAHMMSSAVFGMIFALIARAVQLRGAGAVAAAVVYGLLIMGVMSVVVLPLLGLGAMPGTIGLPSFPMEHVLYGLALGLWVVVRPADVA
jgi:uncharacterized membrane protein YagU involved in acid resistance